MKSIFLEITSGLVSIALKLPRAIFEGAFNNDLALMNGMPDWLSLIVSTVLEIIKWSTNQNPPFIE